MLGKSARTFLLDDLDAPEPPDARAIVTSWMRAPVLKAGLLSSAAAPPPKSFRIPMKEILGR